MADVAIRKAAPIRTDRVAPPGAGPFLAGWGVSAELFSMRGSDMIDTSEDEDG
jgi:hypothetical protein